MTFHFHTLAEVWDDHVYDHFDRMQNSGHEPNEMDAADHATHRLAFYFGAFAVVCLLHQGTDMTTLRAEIDEQFLSPQAREAFARTLESAARSVGFPDYRAPRGRPRH
jgi:hypothetical protein